MERCSSRTSRRSPGSRRTSSRRSAASSPCTSARTWAGRPAITEDDAAALVDGSARRAQEHGGRWAEHLRESERWEQARDAAVQAAVDAADPTKGRGTPGARQRAAEAGSEAGRAFERRNPPPTFDGGAGVAGRLYSKSVA
jgi:hypothetical protein